MSTVSLLLRMTSFQSSTAESCSIACTYHVFFILSPVSGYLGFCNVFALVLINSAAVNTGVHVSFWIRVSLGYMPRSVIAGTYLNSIFNFVRSRHTVLHSGCTSLQLHQQRRRVPFSLKCLCFSSPSKSLLGYHREN